jgi:Tfp pilus assembly protein PilF
MEQEAKMARIKPVSTVTILIAALSLCALGCAGPQVVPMEAQSGFHVELAYGHWEGGQVPQAIEELQIALQLEPGNADAHFMLGFIYSGRQMFNEAIQHYRQAILLRPDWHEGMNNLGVVFLQLDRWDEAVTIFEELVQVVHYATPGHAYNNLGWAQYNLRQTREALSSFEMATYLQPNHCVAYNNQGVVLVELGRERDAVDALEEAIRRCDDYAEPRYHLARVAQDDGRHADARDLFQTCADLVPGAPLGRRCREYLE